MLCCVHSATNFFIFSVCAFISLITCLFCLPICDFNLSFYMCVYIYIAKSEVDGSCLTRAHNLFVKWAWISYFG